MQAQILLMLGDGAGAQAELDRAHALGVRPAAVRHYLAHAAVVQGRYEQALSHARSGDAAPRHGAFMARMEGQALMALGRMDEADAAFHKARRLSPEDALIWVDSARFNMRISRIGAAINAADRAYALAPRNVDVLLMRALMVREQYGPDASRRWFEEALVISPDHIPALVEYAATLTDLGRASQAIALTRRVLTLMPGHARAYAIQAIVAARAGNQSLARSLLARTHGALDDWASIRQLRGVLHLQAGNAALAANEFSALLKAQPLNLRARLLLARALHDDAQYAEAERIVYPLVSRADASPYALMLAGRIHEALGKRAVAGRYLQRAAMMETGPAQVHRGAIAGAAASSIAANSIAASRLSVRALLESGQPEQALLVARRSAEGNPGVPSVWMAQGDVLMALGRYHDAALTYEKAANIRFREDIALRLADAWRRAGDAGKAQRALGLFIAQNPMNVEGQRLMAGLLLAARDYDRALLLLSALRQRLGNEDALLMTDIARAHGGLGQADDALAFAAHAWRLQPMNAVTSDIFGWALLQAGRDRKQAISLLEKAHGLAPDEVLVQFHLGQAYAADGAKDKARVLLRAAADAPAFPHRQEAVSALNSL